MKTTEEMYNNLYEELELEPENSIKLDEYNRILGFITEATVSANKRREEVKENLNIEEVLNSFKKTYLQEVPIYSAVKVNGKKLYEYMYQEQLRLKKIDPVKRALYKTILLAVSGAQRNKYSKIEIDDNIWSLGMVGLISFSFSISCLIFVLMWNG